MTRHGSTLMAGSASGPALVLREPLSFWGGIDVESGEVIDRSHPDLGQRVTSIVLVMAGGRGSSSSSSVLAECLRLGTGPVAIVLSTPDPILTVGALVARTLYGISCPIVVSSIGGISTGDLVRVDAIENAGASIRVDSVGS